MAHTAGPWKINSRGDLVGAEGRRVRFYGDGITLCMSSPSQEEKDNWTLAKIAPDLLEALKNLNAMFDGDGFRPDLADGLLDKLQAADAAIAKAEGREG